LFVLWTLPSPGRQKDKRVIQQKERRRWVKQRKHGGYTRRIKAEAAALAEKREKPVIQAAGDLGVSDTGLAPIR
jgi:hypothetical protein